jgi:hypothetical protein
MPTDKLDKLRVQRDAIAAKIRREQGLARSRERKADTRRKILAGAAVLDEAEHDPEYHAALIRLLGRFLSRDDDRALFGLPPLPQEQSEPGHSRASAAPHTSTETGGVAAEPERRTG